MTDHVADVKGKRRYVKTVEYNSLILEIDIHQPPLLQEKHLWSIIQEYPPKLFVKVLVRLVYVHVV